MDQLLQLLGAALILIAFTAAQLDKLKPQSKPYLVLNLLGAALLTVLAFQGQQWGFFVMETVWTAVSAWGLLARLRATESPKPPAPSP